MERPEARSPARPGERGAPLTVEALVRAADLLLQEQIATVWVEGEVSNLTRSAQGHLYFVLKDDVAQLQAVMFKSATWKIRFRFEDGKRYLVRGRLTIYPERGRFQMIIDQAEPAGLGAAALALEQLKQKLQDEGLFADNRKRELPRLPRRIGVVTSAGGAALTDIIRTVQRRFPRPILVVPVKVQGEGAPGDIARAIRRLCKAPFVDVVIVGRGGGSAEDLSAFNEEVVVRAIAECPVPIISAVGHEVDVTLADLAADRRASTPTAAGELAVPERAVLLEDLRRTEGRLAREARLAIGALRRKLEQRAGRLVDPVRRVERERQKLDDRVAAGARALRARLQARGRRLAELEKRLHGLHPRARVGHDRRELADLLGRARTAIRSALTVRRRRFEAGAARLDAMSPLSVLERGYAIALTDGGRVVTDASAVKAGDRLRVRVARGRVDARVEKIDPKGDDES